ncbi:hypothetical protein GGX14DRAFT_633372 [Mycena pura]|uniref:Zn(2)-C6 fungal-type domain-containing protein n=1 Tax=Mycena pura TaxID=153505 RepID=A0AAD6VBW2_9AGAR|nr:hypothetical protein GGX14DRAFT_633372 [Mycena pura]
MNTTPITLPRSMFMSTARPAVRSSCTPCRRRKLRCDRGSPCGPCMRARTPVVCEYPHEVGRRRPELPKGTACIQCRESKRRCDGEMPCVTCIGASRAHLCEYQPQPHRRQPERDGDCEFDRDAGRRQSQGQGISLISLRPVSNNGARASSSASGYGGECGLDVDVGRHDLRANGLAGVAQHGALEFGLSARNERRTAAQTGSQRQNHPQVHGFYSTPPHASANAHSLPAAYASTATHSPSAAYSFAGTQASASASWHSAPVRSRSLGDLELTPAPRPHNRDTQAPAPHEHTPLLRLPPGVGSSITYAPSPSPPSMYLPEYLRGDEPPLDDASLKHIDDYIALLDMKIALPQGGLERFAT